MKFKLGALILVTCTTVRLGSLQAQDPKNLTCWSGTVQAPSTSCTGQSFQVGGNLYQLTGKTAGLENGKPYNLKGIAKGPVSPCPLSIIDVREQSCQSL